MLLAQARQCRPTMSNFRDLSSLTLPPPTPRARHCAPRHKLSLVYIISLKIIEIKIFAVVQFSSKPIASSQMKFSV